MLVLSRKLSEKILIDGDIVITVLRVEKNRVELGINAPREIPILRAELIDTYSAATPTVSPSVLGPQQPMTMPQGPMPHLVIGRKCGEKVIINGEIVVGISEIYGNGARIGIDAPKSIRICRQELLSKGSKS